jgi:hypothetical protein
MKKSLLTASLVAGSLAFGSAAGLAQQVPKLPPSGTTHFTTYFSVRPAHVVEMVDDSSITVAELVGITVNPDGEPHFHNMAVRCLVTIRVVKGEQDPKRLTRTATIPQRPSTARRTTSSAVPASTRGLPGKRHSRSRPCPRRVKTAVP